MSPLHSIARRTLLCLLAMLPLAPLHAADRQVVGLVSAISPKDLGDPANPLLGVAIKPAVQECFLGIMFIPSGNTGLGSMMLSAALAAQQAGNAVSITYDNSNSCTIKQLAVLTP